MSSASKADIKRNKSILANFKKWSEEYHPYMDFLLQDVNNWYIRIRNLSDEFASGEYIVHMKAPVEYPFKPPEFYFFTQQGVYEINTKVCISIGEYHSNNYAAGQGGMGGFARELVNGIICWKDLGHGIAILNSEYYSASKEKKKIMLLSIQRKMEELAKKSKTWNAEKYPELVKQFNDLPFNIALKNAALSGYSNNVKKLIKLFITGA